MYILLVFTLSFIGFTWWMVIIFANKNSNKKLRSDTSWTGLVDELKALSPYLKTQDQLDSYLSNVDEKIRNYETDYSFLVAFNSVLRDVKARFKETSVN